MESLAHRVASQWLARKIREAADDKVQVRRKDTGRLVWVTKDKAKDSQYEPVKEDKGDGGDEGEAKSEGALSQRVVDNAKELVDKIGKKGKGILRFVTDRGFRQEVGEALKEKASDFKEKLDQEVSESKEMKRIFQQMLRGAPPLSDEERDQAKEQLVDVFKMAVMGSMGAVPVPFTLEIVLLATHAANKMTGKDFSWAASSFRGDGKHAAKDPDMGKVIFDEMVKLIENPSDDVINGVIKEMASGK
jgi:hypothetical protein